MKLNKIHLYKSELPDKGLDEIQLSRLGNVVALVGKNGSGKSRILDSIEENLKKANYQFIAENFTHSNNIILRELKNVSGLYERVANQYKFDRLNKLKKQEESNQYFENELNETLSLYNPNTRQSQSTIVVQLDTTLKKIQPIYLNYIKRINHLEIAKLEESFKSSNSITFDQIIENASEISNFNEINLVIQQSRKFLNSLPSKLVADYNETFGDAIKYKNRNSFRRFRKLKKIFEDFLHKELTWEQKKTNLTEENDEVIIRYKGIWLVDGIEFDYTKLSDGEKHLLAYVMLFFLIELNPSLSIKESIIFIDEPELHLHPESEIELIQGIRKIIGNTGQLWIATHSLNILSHLNSDEIFMVKNGGIFHPTDSNPENSLLELMGIEDRIYKLGEFVNSISDWAYTNFMIQCFFDPEVIDLAGKNDPQIEVFKHSIESTNSKTLLDFGAGKGRLFERLKKDPNFSKIEYFALEPYKELHVDLNSLGVKGIYDDYKKLEKESFDQIVLCNVLHEIPLKEIINTLNHIVRALKPDGHIVIIEDRYLPKGEKIGTTGFLLFDSDELYKLLNLTKYPSIIQSKNPKYQDRILCAVINRQNIKNEINESQLIEALKTMKDNTLDKIQKIRLLQSNIEERPNLSLGRLSGLYSQTYINAVIAEEQLKSFK